MNSIRFIKSFSKGQVTIPKDIRENIGVGDDFWLKVYIENGKIVAEPIIEQTPSADYPQKLLTIKGDWFSEDERKEVRKEVEARVKRLDR